VRTPSYKTVGILGGSTVVAFVLAVGTFDAYLAVLAQLLLVATVVTGAVAMLALRARHHQH
jgi:hypothetical protein